MVTSPKEADGQGEILRLNGGGLLRVFPLTLFLSHQVADPARGGRGDFSADRIAYNHLPPQRRSG